ncbi:alpha/beta fold hydrolase [Methyloterricola oryzae]|uniref:alpha/beta fold hydrolase n=1 Tax=Methyloterricola oryzae TaxID=1495050 RepID=UPI0009E5931F|nr:alpha/beta hydrolase [Methyloterricola oryzae]
MKLSARVLCSLTIALAMCSSCSVVLADQQLQWPAKTYYRYLEVEGNRIFYREAGDRRNPTIVLLHGFPSSSHTYRELIPLLSGSFHIIAPDYLGSGYSDHPSPEHTRYTFDLLAKHVLGLLRTLKINKYAIYIQDFGAPVGYRVMLQSPDSLQALIVQNANAYLDGLTDARREFFKAAHQDRSPKQVALLFEFVSREAIINRQYLRDVKGKEDIVSPDSWTHDLAFLATEADKRIQVQLFQDYYNNLLAYPKWQVFLRERRPPTLIVWGKNDPAFVAAGATAYLRDVPGAELHLLDAGHFAVEEKPIEVAQHVLRFLSKVFASSEGGARQQHATDGATRRR